MHTRNTRSIFAALVLATASFSLPAMAAEGRPTDTESQTNATWIDPATTPAPAELGVSTGISPTATRAEFNDNWVDPSREWNTAPATVESDVRPTDTEVTGDATWVNPYAG